MNRVNVHVADGKEQQFIPILGTDFKSVVDHVLNIGPPNRQIFSLDFLQDYDVDFYIDVNSDWIEQVGYNFALQTLIFELKSGDTMRFDAPASEFQKLVEINDVGDSVGEYYHSDIKNQYNRA